MVLLLTEGCDKPDKRRKELLHRYYCSHLIPLHAWHPMQPLTNMFTINYNWVSGDRECRKSPPHNNTTITSTHQHTITYKQLHKMTSWNKQGWANENIIVHQTVHSFRVCGQLYPWKKPLTHKKPLIKEKL